MTPEQLVGSVRAAADTVMKEFISELTKQQRSYIIDQIARRFVALTGGEQGAAT